MIILFAAIYLNRNARVPGRLMILSGVGLSAVFAIVPSFLVEDISNLTLGEARMMFGFRLVSSFFVFLAGFGFLRFVTAVVRKKDF